MTSNSELAHLLAFVSANYGDWRKLFTTLDDLDQVKAEDVQRAANRYFVATGRTTVSTVLPGQSSAAAQHRSAGPEVCNEDLPQHSPPGCGRPCAGWRHSGIGARRHPAPRRRGTQPAAAARGRVAAAAPAAAGAPSPKDLKYPPLRTIQAPNAATFTLPNGMKLYLLEDHDLPVVAGIALVRTGGLLDPPQRIGLAQLAGITLAHRRHHPQDRGPD